MEFEISDNLKREITIIFLMLHSIDFSFYIEYFNALPFGTGEPSIFILLQNAGSKICPGVS